MSSQLESFIKSKVLSNLKFKTCNLFLHNGKEVETAMNGEKIVRYSLIYSDGSNAIINFINNNGKIKFECRGITPSNISTINDINYDLLLIEKRVDVYVNSLLSIIL